MRMTVGEIVAVTAGALVGNSEAEVTSVTIDTRSMETGALFVAVEAIRDGHDFVAEAFDRGAAAAMVSRKVDVPGFTGVVVDDTVGALGALGRAARDRLADAVVVAITGSSGKTSTKDLTAAALATEFSVTSSPASFNNELGVPLSLLATPDDCEAVVIEVGARGMGQVREQAQTVRHRIGVVTNVGPAHTEMFGSVDNIARAKAELLETLPPDGTAVVGIDHDWASILVERSAAPVLAVGRSPSADVRVSGLGVDGLLRPRFRLETPWGRAEVRLEMRGAHQAVNAAQAVAVAVTAGVPLEQAVEGVRSARGSRWRMEVERTPLGASVINDAYNANPDSTAAALEALASFEAPGRRWAVLGEMAELGELSEPEHARIGKLAAKLGVDRVIAVGAPASVLAAGARDEGCTVDEVDDAPSAAALLLGELDSGDVVLVKASRVAGLELVVEALRKAPAR